MSSKTQINTVLFDLDGTILDTAPDLARALNQLLVRRGKPPLSVDQVRAQVSNGSPGMLGLAFSIDKTNPEFQTLRNEFLEEYENNINVNTEFFPGMEKVLRSLSEMKLRWGIVTNKPHSLADKLINAFSLHEHCACLVGAIPERQSKPHPESLEYACKLLNSEPNQCVFIGDGYNDIKAAKQINMPNIVAMYGYIDDSAKPESWEADYYIDKPMDIIDWLNS